MFNIVEKNQKLVKGLMIFIALTFVMWGVGSYFGMMGDDGYLAKVGSAKIYDRDVNNVLEQNKDAGDKTQVLLNLINRQLILENANYYNMKPTQKQLQNEIASISVFQESGIFDYNKFRNIITTNHININDFEKNVANQILIKQYVDVFNNSYFSSNNIQNKLAQMFSRQRDVLQYTIEPSAYLNQVSVSENEINQYYAKNKVTRYTTPERFKLSYLNLTQDGVLDNIKLDDKIIDDYIASHESSLMENYVDASHILFAVPQNASKSYQDMEYNKAKDVLTQLKTNPSKFSQLAIKYSDDKQSVKKGGNLGRFRQGFMVREFDAVVFNMKPNQISDIIKTQFGYHIIRLNNISTSNNEELRQKATSLLKKQQLLLRWQQIQDQLNDLTYNNPKTLEVAATKLGLKVTNSEWLVRDNPNGILANKKIQDAVFSDEVLQKGNNSSIVDLGNNNLFVFRLLDHELAILQSINQVRQNIIDDIKKDKASSIAYKIGESNILALNNKKLNLNFTNPQQVNLLTQNKEISPDMVRQIFAVDIKSTPKYTGGINADGKFVIYKITGEVLDQTLLNQNLRVIDNINKNQSMFDFAVYVSSLKSKFKVNYKTNFSKLDNNQGV